MEVMQAEDFEALHQVVLKVVTETINGDGEVPPVVLIARLKDHEITDLKAIDVTPFQSVGDEQRGKDALAAFIQMLASREEIDLVAYVSEAWMVTADNRDALEGNVRPSQHPDRQEAVIVSMLSQDCQFFGVHRIERNPSRLVPGDFGPAGNNIQGRFAREQPTMH